MTVSLTTAQGDVLRKEARTMIAIRLNLVHEGRRYAPTPKEIRRACEEIQATWSPRERARRYRGPSAAEWTPPLIRLRDIIEALNEERAGGPA
jgi:hypothetical protein